MKKILILLVIVAVFVSAGMTHADVLYEFQGVDAFSEASFKYTALTFITNDVVIPAADLGYCTAPSGYSCNTVGINPDYGTGSIPPELYDQIIMNFTWGSSNLSWYFYFPDNSFSNFGEYDTISTINTTGHLSVKDSTAAPEPATMLLLAFGLFGLIGIKRKFNK
jgi:hypothetical protein